MKWRKGMAAALAAAMCMSISPAAYGAETEEGKNVVLTEIWDFSSGFYPVMTPGTASNYGSIYWSKNFYNTLVHYGEDGEVEGELAKSWEVSGDGMTYTFQLRDGVKFSDGTEVTSEAVKRSFEAAVQNLGDYNGSYGKLTTLLDTIETPDEATVVLKLSQPYYGTLNDLTMSCPLSIVNPAGLNEDLTRKDDFLTQTMGSGPYMYEGDSSGSTYTFVRNPYYWGEAPDADSFQVKVIEDADARVLALRSGEIDAILGSSRMTYDAYGELSADPSYGTAVDDNASMTRYLGFNLSRAPFDDSKVRQAVAYAMDQETLCQTVLQGVEESAETMFPVTKPYCDVEQTVYELDLEKAAQLMEEAGWVDSDGDGIREKDGQKLELTMTYTSDHGALDDAALAIASQLGKIGFRITPSGSDMMTWYGAVLSNEYEITIYQTYGGAFDPSAVVTNMNPDSSTDPIVLQFPEFFQGGKELVLELDGTSDEARVQEIYREILGTIAEQSLLVPLSYTREFAAWNSSLVEAYDFSTDSLYVNVAGIQLKES